MLFCIVTALQSYYASVVREKEAGVSARLRDKYLQLASEVILRRDIKGLHSLL